MSTDPLPPIETIEPSDLVAILSQINHALPLAFSARTPVKLRVKAWVDPREPLPLVGYSKPPPELEGRLVLKPNPFAEVFKLSRVQAMTGADLTQSVANAAVRQGVETEYQAGERQWGSRVSPALVHKVGPDGGVYYLVCHVLRADRPIYLARHSSGFLTPIPREMLAPFMPPDRSADEAAHQGLERAVVYRNYAIHHISKASLNRRQYRVRLGREREKLAIPAEVVT